MKTYGGVFYSVLTLPVYKDPIETLEDLERVALNEEYDIVTYPKSYYYQLFTKAKCCDSYHIIGQALNNTKIEMPETVETGISLVDKSRFERKPVIFFSTYITLSFGVRSYASAALHISSEALMIDQLAMALQKRSPLLKSMNNM